LTLDFNISRLTSHGGIHIRNYMMMMMMMMIIIIIMLPAETKFICVCGYGCPVWSVKSIVVSRSRTLR